MRGFSSGLREAQDIPVVFLLPQPLFRDTQNGCWQTRTSLLLSLLHTRSPQMTLHGNTHTPVGSNKTCVCDCCLPEIKLSYLSRLYVRHKFRHILYRAEFILFNMKKTQSCSGATSTMGDLCTCGVMLQSAPIHNNHNQINAGKYVSRAEQAWR